MSPGPRSDSCSCLQGNTGLGGHSKTSHSAMLGIWFLFPSEHLCYWTLTILHESPLGLLGHQPLAYQKRNHSVLQSFMHGWAVPAPLIYFLKPALYCPSYKKDLTLKNFQTWGGFLVAADLLHGGLSWRLPLPHPLSLWVHSLTGGRREHELQGWRGNVEASSWFWLLWYFLGRKPVQRLKAKPRNISVI